MIEWSLYERQTPVYEKSLVLGWFSIGFPLEEDNPLFVDIKGDVKSFQQPKAIQGVSDYPQTVAHRWFWKEDPQNESHHRCILSRIVWNLLWPSSYLFSSLPHLLLGLHFLTPLQTSLIFGVYSSVMPRLFVQYIWCICQKIKKKNILENRFGSQSESSLRKIGSPADPILGKSMTWMGCMDVQFSRVMLTDMPFGGEGGGARVITFCHNCLDCLKL